MNNWFDSRWMKRFAGVPPMLSARTVWLRRESIS
jgi:hypothetical protein